MAITAAILGVAGWHAAVWIELPVLIAIFVLFHYEHIPDRHGRWIACRLLAELLRQSRWLALLGRELSLGRNELKDEERRPKEGWLLVFLQAMIRAAPPAHLRLDPASLSLLRDRVRDVLLNEQINYHHTNAHRSGRVAKRLGRAAVGLFVLTGIVVGIEFVMSIFHHGPHWLAVILPILAGVIPTWVAATAAFRQQSEFELLENTSELMHAALVHADKRLEALDCTQPWAAELLGDELVRIADLMTADVADWSLVFKVKAVETA